MSQCSMEERRAIFEHFVTNRRDDLKAEKKAKLKDAKKAFSALLREQFACQLSDGTWDAKTSLSVFLSTLEDALDAEKYKSIQENAMALLPTSVQEKLFEAVVTEFKEQAEKVKAEESGLFAFLQQQLTTGDAAASLRDAGWESEQLQQVVTTFYASKATKALLSKEQQRKVYRRVHEALAPKSDSKYGGGGSSGGYRSSRDVQDERPSRYAPQTAPPSRLEESKSSHTNRPRSRSRGRSTERDSRRSPDRNHGNRSRGDHRSSSRRSRSSTRSRSRSHSRRRRRSSSRHRHRRRSSSSSSSRSRSATR